MLVHHLHRQTARVHDLGIAPNEKAQFTTGKFRHGIAFSICTN